MTLKSIDEYGSMICEWWEYESHQVPDGSQISVWWDYESCEIPDSADGDLIADTITAAVRNLGLSGPITTFSTYGNLSMIPSSILDALYMRSERVVYERGGKKESLLKMTTDMSQWAVENPPPATYVLICGDEQDFSDSLTRLHGLGYNVVFTNPKKLCSSPNYSSIQDLKDKVLSVAMDQHGSHFLCLQLRKGTTEDTEAIFSEVKDHVCQLMLDPFGNYVMQKLFLNCSQQQLRYLVSTVTADFHLFKALCLHSQGSRSMLAFLGSRLMTEEEIPHMISALKQIAILLLKDQSGVQLIELCFRVLSEKHIEPILDVIVSNCRQIATNPTGCCFLQDLMSEIKRVNPTQMRLLTAIMADLFDLSINQDGNDLVQHLIRIGTQSLASAMVDALTGKFEYLTLDKYGITVVEKLMEVSEVKHSSQIIDEIFSNPECSHAMLSHLVQSARKYWGPLVSESPLVSEWKKSFANAS